MTEIPVDDEAPAREQPPAAAREQPPAAAPEGSRPTSIVGDDERAVDPRSVAHARVAGFAGLAPVFGALLIAILVSWLAAGLPGALASGLVTAWVVLLLVACVWAYRWPELHYRHLRYRVDAEGVRIWRGVLWRKVISIPTSRVQHTDVSQGPLQRHFEIATLTVYTAGTEGASIELSGLEQTVARRLRDHLLPDHPRDGDD